MNPDLNRKILRPTIAEIDLEALRYNYRKIKTITSEKVLAVVKASAYGHGAVQVSKLLVEEGVDMLGAATIEEGIELREAGINIPIMVLGSVYPFDNYDYIIKYKLTPIVASQDSAVALENAAQRVSKKVFAHMKVDTGMGRIGVAGETALELWEKLKCSSHIIPEGVFTHLPRADEDYVYTYRQLEKFKDLIARLSPAPSIVHASNTAGLLNFKESHLNMVRPGLALYGLYPDNVSKNKLNLQPALKFKSTVIFVKNVEKGTPVSYGGTWKAPKKTQIATVCVGYADGYRRDLTNKADVLIRGTRCPVVGRVCMDMIMVDVSSLKNICVGEEVVLMGRAGKEEVSAEELASICGTINYEITSGISGRVPRIFKGKDDGVS